MIFQLKSREVNVFEGLKKDDSNFLNFPLNVQTLEDNIPQETLFKRKKM